MKNVFCHMELNTSDPGKAKQFYGSLFEWKFEEMPMGPTQKYWMIQTGADPGGGMQKKPMPEAPTMWLTYVHVADVAASAEKAKSLGGKVIVPKTQIPDMGYFAILEDPTGGHVGIWEAARK